MCLANLERDLDRIQGRSVTHRADFFGEFRRNIRNLLPTLCVLPPARLHRLITPKSTIPTRRRMSRVLAFVSKWGNNNRPTSCSLVLDCDAACRSHRHQKTRILPCLETSGPDYSLKQRHSHLHLSDNLKIREGQALAVHLIKAFT
jgi:hypothetical protein